MRLLILYLLTAFLLTACNLETPSSSSDPAPLQTSTTEGGHLVVAWVEDGNLMVWQSGDSIPRRISSGGVIQPFIAPDGRHIAFTRGPNGQPETLWSVDVSGTAEQELVGERPRSYTPGEMHIGDVAWMDEAVLYYNTLDQTGPYYIPRNDLYRANIRTREAALILPPNEGGRFAISPNREKIVVAYPGTYGKQDGRIAVLDPLAVREPRALLFFVGVSTGSERAYYPPLHWLPDSSAIITSIPDSDLIYHDTAESESVPVTRIWHLPIENPSDRALLGSMRISFFGLPRWSTDVSTMTFLRRSPGTNDFTAYIASYTGEEEQAIFSGAADTLEQPRWIQGSTDFYYARAEPDGTFLYYWGGIGRETQRLSDEIVLFPRFVSADSYVFAAPGSGRIEMRFGHIGADSLYLGSAGDSVPIFDAVLIQ